MGRYFGTDGFRGEAGVGLRAEHAFKIGRFLGWYYGRALEVPHARVVIGRDTRLSGQMLESALAGGLAASGADVYLLGVTTTPGVSATVRRERMSCGIMISASHNPFYDNGIKLFNGQGEKLGEEVIGQIENYLDGAGGDLSHARGEMIGSVTNFPDGNEQYIKYLASCVRTSLKAQRIVLDCANGSAAAIAQHVFLRLGLCPDITGGDPDGFNINAGCGSTHIEKLVARVKEGGYEAGFAYDGDADRCIAVAGDGRVIDGDLILYICGREMKARGELTANTVVTTVMSNIGLYKAFDREGISYIKTPVGDKYVYEGMAQSGSVLGGEQSGHVIFGGLAQTGDGILTSLKLLEAVSANGCSLAELARDVVIYPQLLKNVRVKDKTMAMNDPDVLKEAKRWEEILGSEGRILLRASGTEPLVRIMVEAVDGAVCAQCADALTARLCANGHVI